MQLSKGTCCDICFAQKNIQVGICFPEESFLVRKTIYVRCGNLYFRNGSCTAMLRATSNSLVVFKPHKSGVIKRWGFGKLWRAWNYFKLVARIVRKKCLREPRARERVILPDFGEFAIALRAGGYKIFDLKENKVTSFGVCQNIINKCAFQKKYSDTVLNFSLEQSSCVERMVYGKTPEIRLKKTDVVFSGEFYAVILWLICETPKKTIPAAKYVDDLFRYIRKKKANVLREQAKSISEIEKDLLGIFAKIEESAFPVEINLSLSHGDLNRNNMIVSDKGPILIDWETASYRSIGFEIYNLHILGFRYPQVPLYNIQRSIRAHFLDVSKAVATSSCESLPLEDSQFNRAVFYLEYAVLKMKQLSDGGEGARSNRLRSLRACLNFFKKYESEVGLLN